VHWKKVWSVYPAVRVSLDPQLSGRRENYVGTLGQASQSSKWLGSVALLCVLAEEETIVIGHAGRYEKCAACNDSPRQE
jgi:hypothetical protein